MLRRLLSAWAAELAALLPARVRALPRSFAGRGRRVVRVPRAKVLRRTVVLPLAAERRLRQVLGFEMDRYTPFRSDAVYFQYAVLARDRVRRELRVELAVALRSEADPLIDAARRGGAAPVALDLDGAWLDLRAPGRRWLARAVIAGCVVAALAAAAAPLWRKKQAAEALEAEAAALRGELTLALRAREELASVTAEERSLLERRRLRPAAIEVLEALTRALPDSSWLSHVELAGAQLRIRGEARDAAELVKAIDAGPLFKGAALDGSVTRDAGASSGRERFGIVATTQARP